MNTEPNLPDLCLRAIEPGDVDRLYIWENDPDICQAGCNRAPMSRHQLWTYAQNYDADPFSAGQLRLIIELQYDSKEACGVVDLYDVDPVNSRAMIGIMVAPKYRRRGIAVKALVSLESYCRNQLGLHTLGADVAADNMASRRLFSRAGFMSVGSRPGWYKRGGEFVAAMLFQKEL